MATTKIRTRSPRREHRAHHPRTAWRDYADAMKRLDAARLRLAELADLVDVTRDEQTQAIADAAEAVRRLALPLDRDYAA